MESAAARPGAGAAGGVPASAGGCRLGSKPDGQRLTQDGEGRWAIGSAGWLPLLSLGGGRTPQPGASSSYPMSQWRP